MERTAPSPPLPGGAPAQGERGGTGAGSRDGWAVPRCRGARNWPAFAALTGAAPAGSARCGTPQHAGRQAQAAAECERAHRCQRRAAGDRRKLHAHQQCARLAALLRCASCWHCLILPLRLIPEARHPHRASPPRLPPRLPAASPPCFAALDVACCSHRLLCGVWHGRLTSHRCCSAVGHFRVKIGMLDPPRVVIRDMV